jgi:hypothetical protein
MLQEHKPCIVVRARGSAWCPVYCVILGRKKWWNVEFCVHIRDHSGVGLNCCGSCMLITPTRDLVFLVMSAVPFSLDSPSIYAFRAAACWLELIWEFHLAAW